MSEPVCFTVTAKGEYVNGSSEYVLDGDYITTSVEEDDLFGARMFFYVSDAVGEYLGMDQTKPLISSM